MSSFKNIKKVLSFITCSAIAFSTLTVYEAAIGNDKDISAKTISEIQEQRKKNQIEIERIESQLTTLEGNKAEEKEYQDTLMSQIGLIQENITLLNAELDKIGGDISTAEVNIQKLDKDIILQQAAIDDNVELFKQRLCALYMTGNENLASVVLGSASFYDMMSRVQMVNRIAEYDEELIDNILSEIEQLEKTKKDIETERLTLQMKQEEQQKKWDEKQADIEILNTKMQETQEAINRLQMEQENLSRSKEQVEKEQQELDAEEEEIQRLIAEAQARYEREQEMAREAARKAAEEAARREAEEAARKAAEEAARKKAEEAERKAAEEAAKAAAAEAARKAAEEAARAAAEAAAKDAIEAANRQAAEEEAVRAAAEAAAQQAAAEAAAEAAEEAARLAAQAAVNNQPEPEIPSYVAPKVSSSGFAWPAPGFCFISSYFGARWGTTHKGIDIGDAGIGGGAAVASRSGTVIKVENNCTHNYAKNYSCGCGGGYGNYVVISHDGTYSTLYGHLAYASVSVGDYVEQGQTIGIIGSTGHSTGDHLHFEVRVNGSQVDPTGYVSP